MGRSCLFQACALGFPEGDYNPPAVVAKGEFESAERMVAIALRYGIPVVERDALCESLHEVALDAPIPETLFAAAAALHAEVGILRRRAIAEGSSPPRRQR